MKGNIWSNLTNLIKWIFQWQNAERLKVIFEIIAIPLAGYWAYTVFIESDAPSLVPRSNLSTQINWLSKTSDECQGELKVDFHNIGKKSLEVGKVNLSSWYLAESARLEQSETLKLIDPIKMRESIPLLNQATDDLRFKYEPDVKLTNSFLFVVKRFPKKQILFEIGLWRKEDLEDEFPNWNFYNWDWVCGDNPYAIENIETTNKEQQ